MRVSVSEGGELEVRVVLRGVDDPELSPLDDDEVDAGVLAPPASLLSGDERLVELVELVREVPPPPVEVEVEVTSLPPDPRDAPGGDEVGPPCAVLDDPAPAALEAGAGGCDGLEPPEIAALPGWTLVPEVMMRVP